MRIIAIVAFNVAVVVTCSSVFADDCDFTLNRNGLAGTHESHSAKTLGKNTLALSFQGNFAYDQNLVSEVDGSRKETQPYAVLYDLYPSISYGILDFLDISLLQPLYFDLIEGTLPSGSLGDLELSVKGKLPGDNDKSIIPAIITSLFIPFNIDRSGYFVRHSYYLKKDKNDYINYVKEPYSTYTAGKPALAFNGIVTFLWKRLEGNINLGMVLTFNTYLDNALTSAAGITYKPNDNISLSTDVFFEPRFNSFTGSGDLFDEPLRLSAMLSLFTETGSILSTGCEFRLSSANLWIYPANEGQMFVTSRSEPLWKAFLQFGWCGGNKEKDRDHDQISDKKDKCPDVAEDIDAFQDDDGCPDIDNDNDKIPDSHDSCAILPEDMDGYKDLDGCPDFDNDGDMIADSIDACPNDPEDKDGFEDDDGCAEIDNDSDGISDNIDRCPNISEDKDGFQDSDGCPDYDNDMDAIPDSLDKCPDNAGSSMSDGCPEIKAKEIRFGRLILPGVHFKNKTSEISPESVKELERLYASLKAWPDITIEIQVHTDNILPPNKSLILSRKRAQTVSRFLLEKEIEKKRIKVVGKGSSSPIADNTAEEGRQLNNRVEIHRIK